MATSSQSSSNVKYKILKQDNVSQGDNEDQQIQNRNNSNNSIEGVEELTLSEFLNSVITDNSDTVVTDDDEILMSDDDKNYYCDSTKVTYVCLWEDDQQSITMHKEESKFNEPHRENYYYIAEKNKYENITDSEELEASTDDEITSQEIQLSNQENSLKFSNFLEMANIKLFNNPEKKLSWKFSTSSSIDDDYITEAEDLSDRENNFYIIASNHSKVFPESLLKGDASDSDLEDVFLPSNQSNFLYVNKNDDDDITDTEHIEVKETEQLFSESTYEQSKPFSLPDISQFSESHSKQLLTIENDDYIKSNTDEENFNASEEEVEKEEEKCFSSILIMENQTSVIKIREYEREEKDIKHYNRNKKKKNNYNKKNNSLFKQKETLSVVETNQDSKTDIEELSNDEISQNLNSNHNITQKHKNKVKYSKLKVKNWSNKANKNYRKLAESSSDDDDDKIVDKMNDIKTDEEELNNSEYEEELTKKYEIKNNTENIDEIAEFSLNSITIIDSSPGTDVEDIISDNDMNSSSNTGICFNNKYKCQ